MYKGDFLKGQTVRHRFTTFAQNSAPVAIVGAILSVYKDGSTTEIISPGITVTLDFDTRTGFHLVTIDTTDAFYAAGSDFDVVITAGTVDGISVVGTVVCSFSIQNRSFSLATPEVTSAPAATSSPQVRTAWLFKLARNVTKVSPTGITIRNDADNADDSTAGHSESAGTYTRNKFT